VGGAKESPVLLECLPPAAVAELDAVGLSLAESDDSTVAASVGVLSQAWQVVDTVWPGLSSSIRYLVRCVHLLKAPSRELDCSYSRPALPFSVFLSVPDHGTRARIERVTEALVHETMHLQLSLVERRIQLVESACAEAVAFSPWRGSERNVRGVLHALYVFVVVRALWHRAVRKKPCELDRGFTEERVRAIREEVVGTRHLAGSPGLSQEGRQLVRELLALGGASVGDASGLLHV
jgi:HEXXH motif-containing protein